MSKHIVVVAGNIGVGKTSLTERIGSRLNWWTGYESVADNPYLADFYGDMRAWAFHLQVFFLGHRADQYLEAVNDARSAILDRSILRIFISLHVPCIIWVMLQNAIIWHTNACSRL